MRVFMSMSLDGFVADANGDVRALYPDLENLRNEPALAEMIESAGAVVMGRRAYDMGDTNEGYVDYEHQVPIFVVTHRVPEVAAKHDASKGLTFTFVTEGVPSAIARARDAAGGKDVQVIGGASVVQQLLEARLVDEIHVSLVPILLGDGLRLFGPLDPPLRLEKVKVVQAPARTDLRYRVLP